MFVVGIMHLYGFFDGGEVLLMFKIALLDLVESLLLRIIVLESLLLEQISVGSYLFEQFQAHLEVSHLKFDQIIDEDFILLLGEFEAFVDFPELLHHLVGQRTQTLQVIDVFLDICYFWTEQSGKLKLSP